MIGMTRVTAGRRIRGALVIGGIVAAMVGAFILFFFNPETVSFYPRCPFYALTGLKCPGCGTLRGIHALLHFRFVDAFRFNPLMVVSIPLLVVLLISPRSRKSVWMSRSVLLVVLVYWIMRNI